MKKRTLSPGIPMPPYQPGGVNPVVEVMREEIVSEITATCSRATVTKDLRMIQVNLIDPNPLAPREIYTPTMIRDRAESLRHRQNDPIHVIPGQAGRYIIADGWTRVLACREHGVLAELLAEVHHGVTVKEAAWLGYEQNESREQHCDYDRAMFYERMIEDGTPVGDVASKAGITRQMLALYRSFPKLPTEIRDLVRANPRKFGPWASNELCKLSDKAGSRRAITLAMQFSEEDRTVRWLVGQVQAILGPRPPKGGRLIRQIRYGNGYLKQRDDKFEVSISVPDDKRDDFAGQIEALLSTVAQPVHDDGPND